MPAFAQQMRKCYLAEIRYLGYFQPVLLLLLRVYFGWGFFKSGMGMNDCQGQGGCGEHPGENECKGQGACAVPLSDKTWPKARRRFEALMAKAGKDFGDAPPKED